MVAIQHGFEVAAAEEGGYFVHGGLLEFWLHGEYPGEAVVFGRPGDDFGVGAAREVVFVVGAFQVFIVGIGDVGGLEETLLDELGAEEAFNLL